MYVFYFYFVCMNKKFLMFDLLGTGQRKRLKPIQNMNTMYTVLIYSFLVCVY